MPDCCAGLAKNFTFGIEERLDELRHLLVGTLYGASEIKRDLKFETHGID